jgi:hypothetical protein
VIEMALDLGRDSQKSAVSLAASSLLDALRMRALWVLVPTAFLAVGIGFSGCNQIEDGFGSAGPGGFVPPCSVEPSVMHASLARNAEIIRFDEKDDQGAVGPETIDVVGVFHPLLEGFSVDACGVNPCAQVEVYTVTLDPSGSATSVPDGTFVRLVYDAAPDGSFSIVVSNLADITGVANPIDAKTHLWLQATRGWGADGPFTAEFSLAPSCANDDRSFQGRDLVVSVSDAPDASTTVPLGATQPWVLDTTALAGQYEIRNIASFSDGETPLSAMYVTWKGPLE